MKKILIAVLFLIGCNSGNPSYSILPDPVLPEVNTTVKFCANQTVSYPNSFPEWGLCLQNQLYAVFFDGQNAWWAQIPAGNYRTTSTGLICNFTVKENCVVEN